MIDWKHTLREGLVSGTVAGLTSAVALAVTGRRDAGSTAAAVNAESHWLWGDEALREDRPTLRHTLTGFVTHQLATVFWATLYALVRGNRGAMKRFPQALLGGVATSAAAAAIDYTVVPRRLSPGFEHRLRTDSLVLVYVVFGAGLALGAKALRRDIDQR